MSLEDSSKMLGPFKAFLAFEQSGSCLDLFSELARLSPDRRGVLVYEWWPWTSGG